MGKTRGCFRRGVHLLIISVLVLVSCAIVIISYYSLRQYALRRGWTQITTANSGLPSDLVLTMLNDDAGRIWIATDRGLARFDGHNWVTYTPQNACPQVDLFITAAALDMRGWIWLATDEGALLFAEDHCVDWFDPANSGLADAFIEDLAVGLDGRVWFGTRQGLSEFDGTDWYTHTVADGLIANRIQTVAVDARGWVWVGTREGVSVFDDHRWQNLNSVNGLPMDDVQIVATDSLGTVWLGSTNVGSTVGVACFDGERFLVFDEERSGLPSPWVTAIVPVNEGGVWFGSHDLAFYFDDHSWISYTPSDSGLGRGFIDSIALDQKGRVWFATGVKNGISVFDPSQRQ